MLHEQVDFNHWKQVFDLEALRDKVRHLPRTTWPDVSLITSPYHLAVNEQLRSEAIPDVSNFRSVPTDLFVFNLGEPNNRANTKIGGLPYRQAGKNWPKNNKGNPMTFIGQICFADSTDLISSLPGDILLIFADGDANGFDWDMDYSGHSPPIFEWMQISDIALASKDEVPQTEWEITPCYGSIFRTYDFPDLDPFAFEETWDFIPVIMPATKIHGTPNWVQDDESLPGEFLGALSSISPVVNIQYPFINHQQPISFSDKQDMNLLLWGDVGTMYLFWHGKQIRWTIQGH